MLIRKAPDLRYRDATPKHLYLHRREFIRAAGVAMGAAAVGMSGSLSSVLHAQSDGTGHNAKIPNLKKGGTYSSVPGEKTTTFEDVTSYNNFYEYGYDKSDPKAGAGRLKPRPWSITVEGFVAKKGTFGFDEFIKPHTIEERVYRMRCVEAWSMVIPWAGIPLKDIITYLQPTPQAKYVEFVTAFNPAQMPAQNSRILPWPYVEGLRMDEAMNPLTILAVGLYDEWIPNQNGAPIRLVTPWKYGFKGVKSISKIRFVDYQPKNTWQVMAPNEYGFYANVNPDVSHPRWRQDSERRIGEFFRRKTLPFNGYADQVASLYTGMDLKRNF